MLFIDEAYSLSSGSTGNTGVFEKECIATLIKEMENNRESLCVILAGYKDEMEELINANTGFRSRIQFFIDFPDYTENEMLEIFENTCILLAKAEQAHLLRTRTYFTQEGLDITPVQWLVLYALYKKDGESLTQLAKRCYLDNSTITGVVDRLEKAGYVSREPLEGDRRVYKIVLRPRAHQIREKAAEITNGIFSEMTVDCTDEEIAVFRKVLLNIFEKLS